MKRFFMISILAAQFVLIMLLGLRSMFAEAQKIPALILAEVKFDEGLSIEKVKNECNMLGTLKKSVIKYAEKYSLNINSFDVSALADNEEKRLLLTYIGVDASSMSGVTFRPASAATLRIDIEQNGAIVSGVTKRIGSKSALTACSRLEKIANTHGRFVAKWIKKND